MFARVARSTAVAFSSAVPPLSVRLLRSVSTESLSGMFILIFLMNSVYVWKRRNRSSWTQRLQRPRVSLRLHEIRSVIHSVLTLWKAGAFIKLHADGTSSFFSSQVGHTIA